MAPKKTGESCCEIPDGCHVEAVVTVDERGQMVLPKDLRERAGIGAGEKVAIIAWQKDGVVCCLSLVKTNALGDMVKGLLRPMMADLVQT